MLVKEARDNDRVLLRSAAKDPGEIVGFGGLWKWAAYRTIPCPIEHFDQNILSRAEELYPGHYHSGKWPWERCTKVQSLCRAHEYLRHRLH